jgi:hypothetical protein
MPEHRFHTPEPVELEVKVPVGDIDVETVDGDETIVTLEASEKVLDHFTVEQRGRRIVVEMKGKKSLGITIQIGDLTWGSGGDLKVRVRMPHGSQTELATAAADVKLRGRLRSLESKSASGDLVMTGEIERDANVKTVSGDVRLDRIGGDLRFTTVSGDFLVRAVSRSVMGKSVSGDVRLESTREGDVSVQSVSGDIEVGVEPGTNLDVDAGSLSGDLNSEVPLGSESMGGDGPTLVLRGKTVSGDFRVFRA